MDHQYNINKVRNFAIIAHIDHGKSTLADRILERTGTIDTRIKQDRVMDTLELEKERGITIKLQTARMKFVYTGDDERYKSDEPYIINLVDTPGHVDFSYEVSRSLAASEGAILLIDAGQGIQAQTLTTFFKALENDVVIIPVINKIDLPSINIAAVEQSLIDTFGFHHSEIIRTSGKTGAGVEELLNKIVELVPPPQQTLYKNARALVYDSFYHEYKGVVALVKVVDGEFNFGEPIATLGTGIHVDPIEVGFTRPELVAAQVIKTGEVGYLATGLKDIRAIHVGDTIVLKKELQHGPIDALPGYQPPKPMVFASLYPIDADDFDMFKEGLEKLALNDAALTYQKESSKALGSGYLCGFLGLLHMEITQERLNREFGIDLITTTPSVEYKISLNTKDAAKVPELTTTFKDTDEYYHIHTAAEFPDKVFVKEVQEPWVNLEIITPEQYIGSIMDLCQKNRGEYKSMEFVSSELINGTKQAILKYNIPVAEIITNFFDKLKSVSQGYASMDYVFNKFQISDIVKVNIIINDETVEALSFLTHSSNSETKGRKLVTKLGELIPRQQIPIPIQASIGFKIFARETIRPYRKDVLAKMSGGDVTRKNKLLDKQKKGKKKAKEKMIGKINVPQEVFLKALKLD